MGSLCCRHKIVIVHRMDIVDSSKGKALRSDKVIFQSGNRSKKDLDVDKSKKKILELLNIKTSSDFDQFQEVIKQELNTRPDAADKFQEADQAREGDVSKWKYSELYDTLYHSLSHNESGDAELLKACRHELMKRVKIYNAWKEKHARNVVNERTPPSVLEYAQNSLTVPQNSAIDDGIQRYFKISFRRPGTAENQQGWWYAHFDGPYVARQMEISPEKKLLYTAGKDLMRMCKLSLEETGLTRKSGAAILEDEFNKEWEKNGGDVYIRPGDKN